MNNPYLLKKQLKENEEELSNYLRDMNIWQEQMKRKEFSPPLKNSNEKKKSEACRSSNTTIKKISSWDYSAWEKFDVDKACENIDVQEELKYNDNYSDISIDKSLNQELQSKLSEGLYEKNLGNALVKNQKWAEAILRYTRAIEYYNNDPVFYANRALCYLKTNEFKLAISDCTSSLKLDGNYVKSYQRRSAAYIALKMYKEAKKDLNEILKLEPNNKQAKLDIEVVKNKLNVVQENSNINIQKTNAINKIQDKNTSNILFKDVKNLKVIPKWPARVDCKQITSNQKPPHLRSKKPFCTLKIKDVHQEELDNMHLLQTTLKEVCENKRKNDKLKNKEVIMPIKNDLVQTEKKHSLAVPSPPQTYVQLKYDWSYLRSDSKLLFQYLKQIPGKRLPLIVYGSLDNDLFMDILRILRFEFIQNGHDITDYLIGISKLPRLQLLMMFCSDNEVLYIKEMLNHVSKFVSENTYKSLKNSFGV